MEYINHTGLLSDRDIFVIKRELLIAKRVLIGCVVEEYSQTWKDILYDRYN